MDYLDKVYLWLGLIDLNQNDFKEYFKLDYSVEGNFEDPNYKICGFCEDIGELWYDQDLIGYIKYDEKMTVIDILEEAPIDEDCKDKIVSITKSLKLELVNAIYWYSGKIDEPSKEKTYNGLKYIGEFNLD
ncbi:immunity 22 family protein [Lacinutrix salivirga]